MEFLIKMGLAKRGIQLCRFVSQGSSFGRETRLAGKLVLQGNSFCRKARFLLTSLTFIIILLVKHIIYNTKVGEIISFCDLNQ